MHRSDAYATRCVVASAEFGSSPLRVHMMPLRQLRKPLANDNTMSPIVVARPGRCCQRARPCATGWRGSYAEVEGTGSSVLTSVRFYPLECDQPGRRLIWAITGVAGGQSLPYGATRSSREYQPGRARLVLRIAPGSSLSL